MRYSFRRSYIAGVKKLDNVRAANVHKAFESLMKFFQSGEKTPGLGLKQLRPGIWEIRAGLLDRIIFRKTSSDMVEFIIAGTHNEIKKLLKNL